MWQNGLSVMPTVRGRQWVRIRLFDKRLTVISGDDVVGLLMDAKGFLQLN